MPFCPTDLCDNCGCCMEVVCRPQFGGCHEPMRPEPPRVPLDLHPLKRVRMLPPLGLKWTND